MIDTIDEYAFDGCIGLTSVVIPSSVTFIGGYAFYNCNALILVTLLNTDPNTITVGGYAFHYNHLNRKFKVPAGTVASYQGSTKWDWFNNTDFTE